MTKMEEEQEKYIRGLKELAEYDDEEKEESGLKAKVYDGGTKPKDNAKKEEPASELTIPKPTKTKPYTVKDIFLGIINIVLLSTSFFILFTKLPQKGSEYHNLETEILKNESGVWVGVSDIKPNQDKANEIQNLFLDETGILGFVKEVENLKSKYGIIEKIAIPTQVALKDQTNNYGIPVVIELRGNWEDFNKILVEIGKLPYLFRPVTVEVTPFVEDKKTGEANSVVIKPNSMTLNYGGFLYVKDNLSKTK